MNGLTATYSPDDNKLRLYPAGRLDEETYRRVKAHGFKWAPKQQLFVAPMWTPEREDLLIELAGEIGDEDKSLVERAEERADRFSDYSEAREQDAEQAREAVHRITENIPFGQPILVGHHSEARARKDAERIEKGMRKAVQLWKTSEYWRDRAAGAIGHAKYKELPDVRARRIKTIEADKRKQEKEKARAEWALRFWNGELKLKHKETGESTLLEIKEENRGLIRKRIGADHYLGWLSCAKKEGSPNKWDRWSACDVLSPDEDRYQGCPSWTVAQVQARALESYRNSIAHLDRWINHFNNRLEYERAMLAEAGGLEVEKHDIQVGGRVLVKGEWVTVLRVNRSGGVITSLTTNRRYVSVVRAEEIKGYEPPTPEAAEAVKSAQKLPPLCNYPGDGFRHMTNEEWKKIGNDFKGTRIAEQTPEHGRHRYRFTMRMGHSTPVFITDAKVVQPPAPEMPKEDAPAIPPPQRTLESIAATHRPASNPAAQPFKEMAEKLKQEVQVVSAPQLFETPLELADRMVRIAAPDRNHKILEPSAGTGSIIRSLLRRNDCAIIQAVEKHLALYDGLKTRFGRGKFNIDVHHGDFLSMNGNLGMFDRILMNPPFHNAEDIKHITHALSFLNPGGRLVALCANGPRQREKLMPLVEQSGGTWEHLPAGTFKESGTNVNAALIVIEKK